MKDLEKQRRQLARGYELMASKRMTELGFQQRAPVLRRIADSLEAQLLTHYFGSRLVPRWRMSLRRLTGARTLPDFAVIGPIKSGTSDLAISLMLHPNILPPLIKEVTGTHPHHWRNAYPTEREKCRHAEEHGIAMSPYLSPAFFHSLELGYNFSRHLPDAKVALTLRNPVDRVYSQWKWEYLLSGRKLAKEYPFVSSFAGFVDAALEAYPDRIMYNRSGFQPLQTSIYYPAVRHWIEAMGASNVLVLDVGEYFRDPEAFLQEIYAFVGLPAFPAPKSAFRINENPLTLPPPDESSLVKLTRLFQPHNEMLWDLLNKRFSWSRT